VSPCAGGAFSADNQRALTGSFDGRVCLWDLKTGKQVRLFRGHLDRVNGVAFTPDGRRALSCG
jgi:WD40 repeat protein